MKMSSDQKLLAPWAEEIPQGWKVLRIDYMADVLFSHVDKHAFEEEISVRLCNYVDVYKNEKITHKIDFMEASADQHEINRFQIHRGDVLLTKDSEAPDDIAIAALVDEELPGVVCGYHLALIRSRMANLKGAFLAWVHKSKAFRAQYEAQALGVTRFGLSQYAFRSARIPLPPQYEQEQISTYLDKQCAVIDKTIEIKKEQLKILEELRKSIIYKAVTKGLDDNVELKNSGIEWIGKLPAGWKLDRIKDVAEIITGNTPPKDDPDNYEDGIVLWIKPNQLRGNIVNDSEEKLSEKGAGLARVIPKEAILVGCIGDVGNFAVAGCRLTTNQQINSLIFNKRVHKPLAKYLIEITRDEHKKNATLVVVPILNKGRQGQICLVLPPINEQIRIQKYLDKKIDAIELVRDNIQQQMDVLVSYRASLIHECVTGKRRITDQDLKERINV
jgi:type I restriction enzyme S subunit